MAWRQVAALTSRPLRAASGAWWWLALPMPLAALWVYAGLVSAGLGQRSLFTLAFPFWFGWPGCVIAACARWLARPGTRLAHAPGGLAAVGAGVYETAEVLQPRHNHDANIGLGLFPLVGPALLVLYALVFWLVRGLQRLTRR